MSAYNDDPTTPRAKRKNGEGSIIFDGKAWVARLSYHDPVTGKLKRKSFAAKTYAGAEARLSHALGKPIPEEWIEEEGGDNIYFVQAFSGGPIKIGRTSNVKKRLQTLQVSCPIALRLLHVIPGVDASLEQKLHKRFGAYRLHGEWFDNTSELMGYIRHLKKRKPRKQKL